MSESWLTRPERGNKFLMHALTWVTRRLGRPIGRLLLYPICLYFVMFSRGVRRVSRCYLERVLERPVGIRDVFRHYYTFASTMQRYVSRLEYYCRLAPYNWFNFYELSSHSRDYSKRPTNKATGDATGGWIYRFAIRSGTQELLSGRVSVFVSRTDTDISSVSPTRDNGPACTS